MIINTIPVTDDLEIETRAMIHSPCLEETGGAGGGPPLLIIRDLKHTTDGQSCEVVVYLNQARELIEALVNAAAQLAELAALSPRERGEQEGGGGRRG